MNVVLEQAVYKYLRPTDKPVLLTNIARRFEPENPSYLIQSWLRSRNTIELKWMRILRFFGIMFFAFPQLMTFLTIFTIIFFLKNNIIASCFSLLKLIYGIKKIISYFNSCRNIYSLHCSAVKKDGKAFVFLAGSYSGKTTLFLNLIHNGYEPINDDIAFWEYHDNNIYIKGIPILFSKRKDKNGLIMSDGYLRAERDENQKDIYSNNVFCESIVDTVFIPEYGHVSSAIADFKSINIKKLLRACSIHSDLVADERFVQSINGLLTCSFRKLEMSNDYNDIIKCIIEAT